MDKGRALRLTAHGLARMARIRPNGLKLHPSRFVRFARFAHRLDKLDEWDVQGAVSEVARFILDLSPDERLDFLERLSRRMAARYGVEVQVIRDHRRP